MVLAQFVDELVKVLDHHIDVGIRQHLAVGPEKTGSEIQTDHAARITDRI